jgi:hypothetical protein
MKKLLKTLVVSGVIISSVSLGMAFNSNEARHLKSKDIVVPHGEMSLQNFFKELQTLNPNIDVQWPEVSDQREIMFFRNAQKKSSQMSLFDLAMELKHKIKSFDQAFSWEIGRHSVKLSAKNSKLSSQTMPIKKMPMPEWAKTLPTMSQAVNIKKGESAELQSGYYEQAVVIDGNCELKGDKFAFSDLKVSGTMNLNNQSIAGDTLDCSGQVTLNSGSHAQFETVTTKGQLNLKTGSQLMVKDIILDQNGDLILGENADLILN